MKIDIGPYEKWGNSHRRWCRVKVHEYDRWCADKTLSVVIAAVLKGFLDCDKIPAKLLPNFPWAEFSEAEEEALLAQWHAILKRMYWAFDQIAHGEQSRPHVPAFPDAPPATPEEMALIEEWAKKNAEYDKLLQEGIDLFAQHFRDLWL